MTSPSLYRHPKSMHIYVSQIKCRSMQSFRGKADPYLSTLCPDKQEIRRRQETHVVHAKQSLRFCGI